MYDALFLHVLVHTQLPNRGPGVLTILYIKVFFLLTHPHVNSQILGKVI